MLRDGYHTYTTGRAGSDEEADGVHLVRVRVRVRIRARVRARVRVRGRARVKG